MSYAADISLHVEEKKKGISLDKKGKVFLYVKKRLLQVNDFANVNENALAIITHDETGLFDTIRASAAKPVFYSFPRVRKCLALLLTLL